ncbi:MAG: hypothetical protein PHF35_03875 [Candidatus Moranbacteria bacterium]|nr:hypothetical protein [Candidatus Moranbacteria bacterium]
MEKIKLKLESIFRGLTSTKKRRIAFFLAISLLSALVVIGKRMDVVTNPQFYAEDGTFWYSEAYNLGPANSLLIPKQGYFQTISRLGAIASQFVGLANAPLVMNLIAIFIQLLPIIFLLSSRFNKVIPRYPIRLLIIIAYLLLPHAGETHANLTNAQWRLAILMLLVIIAENPKTLAWKFFDAISLLISGLSGPFSILMLPIFAVYEYFSKKKRYFYLLIIFGTAAIQITSSVLTLKGQRSQVLLGASLPSFFKIASGNIFIASLIGSDFFGSVRHLPLWENGFLPIFIGVLGITIFALVFWKSSKEMRLFLVFSLTIFTVALITPQVSAKKPQWDLMIKGAGGRYYLLPSLAWIVSLGYLLFKANNKIIKYFSLALLLIFLFVGSPRDFFNEKFKDFKFRQQVSEFEKVPSGTNFEFKIYPKGWRMNLVKK